MKELRKFGGVALIFLCLIEAARHSSAGAEEGAASDQDRASVLAVSVNPTFDLPLTQAEQAGRISGLASQVLGRKVFPIPVEAIAPAPYIQRDYRSDWINASQEGLLSQKQLIAEKIGNQGRARYAAEQGWQKLLKSQGRMLRTGPDSAYWDPRTGKVRVVEAKGGGSPLDVTYGSPQGTNLNAISSAEGVLKSAKASSAEQLASARLIKAAQENRLETGVVRTRHVQGRPDPPVDEGAWDRTSVAKKARDIEQELTQRNPALKPVFDKASHAQSAAVSRYRISKAVAFLGLAGSGLQAWDAFQQSREAWLMWNDPVLGGTAMPYLQTSLAVGRWGESATLGLGSAAELGLLGQGQFSAFGRTAGRWFLPITLSVEGLSAGSAYYEFKTGRISQLDFYRRTTGPAILGTFTTSGAIIGGCVGAAEGGVGAWPGAAIGAQIGAIVAIPFQFTADWSWNLYYGKFDERQRKAVDRAVESYYGVAP